MKEDKREDKKFAIEVIKLVRMLIIIAVAAGAGIFIYVRF